MERELGGSRGHNFFVMQFLICFALKEEAAPFHKIAAGRPGIFTVITGIGRQNAEKSVRSFLNSCSPELVLTCGFAGGLNPELKIGEVVFEIFPRSSRGDEAQIEFGIRNSEFGNRLEPPYVGCYEKLVAAGAKPAKFFCADRIAITIAEKKKLRDGTGADAVEMESAAIHAVCAERGISCATVRVISDTANENLPLDFNALAKPDKNLDFGKLFFAVAKSPGKIGALLELQKKTKFAAERLAEVLSKILQSSR
jgi:adenosylhomocysteine nucleosidase